MSEAKAEAEDKALTQPLGVETEAEAKSLALRQLWPRGLNISGMY